MEVWNGIWKKILVWNGIWNGRFLVWNENGMEEHFQYGVWKNLLPFHSIPCPVHSPCMTTGFYFLCQTRFLSKSVGFQTNFKQSSINRSFMYHEPLSS